jgi:membrane-associated PAP2 superfamily phosphatase
MRNKPPASVEAGAIPRHWLAAPLLLGLMLVGMENTGADIAVSHWFYDAAAHTFPLRYSFLLDTMMHHWAKYSVILLTCMVGAGYAFTFVIPALRAQRRLLLFIVLAMTLAPLTVTLLKQVTDRPCPWDLAEFGGALPHTRLFESRGEVHARGQCFPAGHASTGFALLALFFAAHHRRRMQLARAALAAGIAAGLLLGVGRIAQGAHFLSHVLWAGLVCWLVMVVLYGLMLRGDTAGSVTASG